MWRRWGSGTGPRFAMGPGAARRAGFALTAAATAAALSAACVPALSGTGDRDAAPPAGECRTVRAPDGSTGRQLRGMWIATVAGIDWPSDARRSAARKQADFRRLLDTATALRLNAVVVQIRPTADAFYPSPYEPWSQWITGRQGKNPGYDVLGHMVREAHARGLEFHAWFNPYRVSRQRDLKRLAATNPARRNPGWVRRYGTGLWYDPGLPQVRDLVSKVVLDVVRKYDVDAVHFDDYFYPYPESRDFPDKATYRAYGKGFKSKAAWRRHNVNVMVRRVSGEVHRAKPWVRFGISPFGVWRNAATDRAGSATRALQSYDDIYADSRLWVRRDWVDYIVPQLYWPIGDRRAAYRTLTAWWSRQVRGTDVQLHIGHGAYRVGEPGPWREAGELSRQLDVNKRHPQVRGDVFFSARDLAADRRGFARRLAAGHYARPALVPVAPRRATGRPPAPPAKVTATAPPGKAVTVRWRPSGAARYAVYRVEGKQPGCARIDPRTLVTTAGGAAVLDRGARPGATYTYYVTALDRAHRESRPARGATITASQG
ncbi:MAG TPA: family 10 glycosylhydrolase [Streptosporangiaceae bacterium]|nr:family 10 glycosylhydrolase [Streptosporangiaceae bacterium]